MEPTTLPITAETGTADPTPADPTPADPTPADPTPTDPATAAGPRPVFLLADADPLRPAVTLGQGWPGRVSGLPAFYFWKDALRVGTYAHPAGRYSLSVTRDKLDGYAATFSAMRANGVGVPILMDHAPTAAATLGWIVAVRRDGDRLLELHQFLGEAARDTGLRNHVSLGIDPDFVDGRGVRYGEAIVHSAVTPVPVVPGQDEFTAASAGELAGKPGTAGGGRATVALSLVDPEQSPAAPPRVPAEPEAVPVGPSPAAEPAAVPPGSVAATPFGDPVLTLSLLADAAAARRDLAVARGGLDPATADALLALLSGDATVGLSRTATGRPLAVAVFDALAANRPVPLGEATGPQSAGRLHLLSRPVPGGEAVADLTGRMIALASGTETAGHR